MSHTNHRPNVEIINSNAIDDNVEQQLAAFGGDNDLELPEVEDLFTRQDDYETLMRLAIPASSFYHHRETSSRPLLFNTSLPGLQQTHLFGRPRFRFVAAAKRPASRFLASVTDTGLDERLIKAHLENHAVKAPYLLASYHGLLGMALASVAVQASEMRDVYHRASAEGAFPPKGEILNAMSDEQDVWLPSATPWLSTLCAPVRFNRFEPATYQDFLPETDNVVRWQAFKERYRCAEYQATLPSGVSTVPLNRRGALSVEPINDGSYSASQKHPIVVTFPSGIVVMMCLNSADGFGPDRYSQEKSPLLDWAVVKMQHRGGLAAIFRHGLQRTVYSLLAEEVVKAEIEGRRASVPWVTDGRLPQLPVVLDSEVCFPKAHADDVFGHMLQNFI